MTRALVATFGILVFCAAAPADLATLTLTCSGSGGSISGAVTCDAKTITVDLSGLPKDAPVVRAVLRPAGDIAAQVRNHAFKAPPPVTVTAEGSDKPLALLPPRYVSFDATSAVEAAVKKGAGKVVFNVASLPGYNRTSAVLEVTTSGKPKGEIPKATGIHVHHKSGQTFITWSEPAAPLPAVPPLVKKGNDWEVARPPATSTAPAKDAKPPETLPSLPAGEFRGPQSAYLRARLSDSPRLTFRVYKHAEPITAGNIAKAVLVDEVDRLSSYNLEFNGHYTRGDWQVVRVAVEDAKPLPPLSGVCVLNPPQAGKAYYAVSVAVDGEENLAAFEPGVNAAKDAVEEVVGQGEPVLQKTVNLDGKGGSGNHHFYASQATLYFYTRWEAPPNGNRSDNPIDYCVGIPPKLAEPAPVDLHLHGWGGNMMGGGFWTNYAKGWMIISSNQVPYDWWTGYHECSGTWRSWADGTVHDYTQTRLMSFIDWVNTKWKIDMKRISVQGGSMGGSGTTNLGVHRADRVAFAAGTVGVHVPANSPQFTSSYIGVYGPVEWKLPIADGKTAAFDYFSNVWYLKNHVAQSMPLIVFSNGKNDGQIGWPQALEFFNTFQETRQPHMFFWGLSGHGQGLSLPGEPAKDHGFNMDIRSDRTLPAFTHCSLDDKPGTATRRPDADVKKDKEAAEAEKKEKKLQWARAVDPYDGDSIGQANAYLYWDTDDARIVDEPAKWGLTLALTSKAAKDECTVDVTPRRCQKFAAKQGDKFKWSNCPAGSGASGDNSAGANAAAAKPIQSGEVTADEFGLVTIKGVKVSKGKNVLLIEKI